MKTYWDSSALINAAVSSEVMERLKTGEHFTRLHTFSEFFSHMTGRGIKVKDPSGATEVMAFSPNETASFLRQFAEKIEVVELDKREVLAALEKAQSQNIQGGKVYDYLHAAASKKAKADELLTRNTDDFAPLADNVRWP